MKPMLASKAPDDLSKLIYPLYASPKLDGIRCIIDLEGRPLSRTLKPIRNQQIAEALSQPALAGLDGELIVGDPNAATCMRTTNSGVMSKDKDLGEDWKFYVFDVWARAAKLNLSNPHFEQVLAYLEQIKHPNIVIVDQHIAPNWQMLEQCERNYLDDGYEGAMVRRPVSPYKFGRSTVREGYLLKLKRFHQAEARIIGFEPLYHNANEAIPDNLGYTKRSSHQEGKVALDTLGAFICRGQNPNNSEIVTEFKVGTGFTAAERLKFWHNQNTLLGRQLTYKFFPTGSKDRPRHPVFVSFRDPEDL